MANNQDNKTPISNNAISIIAAYVTYGKLYCDLCIKVTLNGIPRQCLCLTA